MNRLGKIVVVYTVIFLIFFFSLVLYWLGYKLSSSAFAYEDVGMIEINGGMEYTDSTEIQLYIEHNDQKWGEIFNGENEGFSIALDTEGVWFPTLVLYNDMIFAGSQDSGRIYKSSDGIVWDVAFDSTETVIFSLTTFDNYIYAGTYPNGYIYRSNNGVDWTQVLDISDHTVLSLISFQDYVYAGSSPNGYIYRSSDGVNWTQVFYAGGVRVQCFGVYDGYIYIGTGGYGRIFRSADGLTWTQVFSVTDSHILSILEFGGYLYASTGVFEGKVFRSADGTSWDLILDLTQSYSRLGMYDGALYLISGLSGVVYKSGNGVDFVQILDPLLSDIDSILGFNGSLYIGMGRFGDLYRLNIYYPRYMRFSNDDGSWSEWEEISENKMWSLEGNEGLRTVNMQFKDLGGNILDFSDTITLDLSPPTKEEFNSYKSGINVFTGLVVGVNPYIIKVKAVDNLSGIEKVEFYIDESLVCTVTEPNSDGLYECAWDTVKYHTDIRVVMYDRAGNVGEFEVLGVEVSARLRGVEELTRTGIGIWLNVLISIINMGLVKISTLRCGKISLHDYEKQVHKAFKNF